MTEEQRLEEKVSEAMSALTEACNCFSQEEILMLTDGFNAVRNGMAITIAISADDELCVEVHAQRQATA